MKLVVVVALSLSMLGCQPLHLRHPSFLPEPQLDELKAALSKYIPDLWSEVTLAGFAERDELIIYLRPVPTLGSKKYASVCSQAVRTVEEHLAGTVARSIKLIREWRVIHDC